MKYLLLLFCIALATTLPLTAAEEPSPRSAGKPGAKPDPNDPVEKEYQKLLADDDAAQAAVDKMITENQKFVEQGAGITQATLKSRVLQRFDPVQKSYVEFLKRNPHHVRARLAYGSFLGDIGKEDESMEQWEKARELDPADPATWNNLANYYGHNGPVTNAFAYYSKAIELNPKEPVYYQNLATTVYLFRMDATNFFNIPEQKVFDKALDLYRQALRLDPTNFPMATDLAQTFYGIKPTRFDDAMAAWQVAEKIANDDIERQGIYLHYARLQINAGQFEEAGKNLSRVTQPIHEVVKNRLVKKLAEEEAKPIESKSPVPVEKGKIDKPPVKTD